MHIVGFTLLVREDQVLMEQTLLGLRDQGASVSGLVFNEDTETVVEVRDGLILVLGVYLIAGSPINFTLALYNP